MNPRKYHFAKVRLTFALFLIAGCGSGLCPLGSAYRANCPIAGGGSSFVGAIGVLDTSFGGTGIVTTAVIGTSSNAYSIALQPDGKILLGGSASIGATLDFAIARYHANGSLDTTFNGTGYVTTAIGANNDQGRSITLQPDGKILLGGFASIGGNDNFAIARYHANGSLDTTFNGSGFVTRDLAAQNDWGHSIVLQPDGKILLGGKARIGGIANLGIVRYHANGSLDTTFNGTGTLTTNIAGGDDEGFSLALQPDGKILFGGAGFIADHDLAIVRYHANGSLDTTFNSTGIVTTAVGSWDYIYSLALQPDGKIVAGGFAQIGANNNFAIARYHANGSLDSTFNGTGIVTTAISPSQGQSLALQPDGKILLGGYYSSSFIVSRYHANGSLDTTFNTTGIVTTNFSVVLDWAFSLALQPDGKILLGGYSNNVGPDFFSIVRYR